MIAVAAALGGCRVELPEENGPAAKLYRQRCSGCHGVYAPSVMRYPMWEVMVARMEMEIARARQRPLGDAERQAILDYLRKHSG